MPACPSDDTLEHFHFGRLPCADVDMIADHLADCPRCQATLQKLDSATDSVIQALRAPKPQRVSPPTRVGGSQPPLADAQAPAQDFSFLRTALEPGDLGALGHYRVIRVLGQGGMGCVFEAEDVQLRRRVALKVLISDRMHDVNSRQRFLREARAMAQLRHDHIVTVYHVGQDDNVPHLAMEYLQGKSLDDCLETDRPLSDEFLYRLARETAEGLAAAHEHGLVHRDIKPSNLWLEARPGGSFRVKILDFGLARAEKEDVAITQSGYVVGTPAFMAPEQARGENVDARGDLFSLGCVLYWAATGVLPFDGSTTLAVLSALAMDDPKPPSEYRPDLAPAFADLILKLLAKDRNKRPPTAREVAQAVAGIENPTAELPTMRPPAKSRRAALLFAAGAVVLAILVPIGILFRPDSSQPEPTTTPPPPTTSKPSAAVTPEWIQSVRAMRPDGQLAAVRVKLQELNPEFDGRFDHRVMQNKIVDLGFTADRVQDLSPVQALDGLEYLNLKCNYKVDCRLTNLKPLADMKLKRLDVDGSQVSDLTPLRDLPALEHLSIRNTPVRNLEALRGVPLKILYIDSTIIEDLGPLKDSPLLMIVLNDTPVTTLEPLRGMRLQHIAFNQTKIVDLGPLEGMPLLYVSFRGASKVASLVPLKGAPIEFLIGPIKPERDIDVLVSLKKLKEVNSTDIHKYWKQIDDNWPGLREKAQP